MRNLIKITMLLFALSMPVQEAQADEADLDRMIPVADLRADFQELYEKLQSGHYNLYARRDKGEYDAFYEETLASFTAPLSLYDTQLKFLEFAAYGNVAHAHLPFPISRFQTFRENGGRVFPIWPKIIDGRFYVSENFSGKNLAPGTEVLQINGLQVSEWFELVSKYIAADSPELHHSIIERPGSFSYLMWLLIGEIDEFEVVFKLPNGEQQTQNIKAMSRDEFDANTKDQPETFSIDFYKRESKMLTENVAYLYPGPFFNINDEFANDSEVTWLNNEFVKFIDAAFEEFLAKDAETLIIDLRDNPGGDNSFSDHMIAWFATEPFSFASAFNVKSSPEARASNQVRLDVNPEKPGKISETYAEKYAETTYGNVFQLEIPKTYPRTEGRFEGKVYVLINNKSYSNAVSVAALVQDYGFGTIIGEETADLATSYGAMEFFSLSRTKLDVRFPKAHIIRPAGEDAPETVRPDLEIVAPIVAPFEDVVLQKALEIVEAENTK